MDVVLWFDPIEDEEGRSVLLVLSKICCGFVVSDKWRLRRAFSSLYCLENWMWFRGLTQGKEKESVQFGMFSRKYAVVLWFHPGEDKEGPSVRYIPSEICCGFVVWGKGAHNMSSNLLCSLEKLMWFCGFSLVTEKKVLHFDMFSRKYAVILWFHRGEN